MKYFAVYKCALCGQLIHYGNSKEVSYSMLPELIAKVIQNQQFAGNSYLYQAPMNIPHQCKDYNAGMAYFVGFMKDE